MDTVRKTISCQQHFYCDCTHSCWTNSFDSGGKRFSIFFFFLTSTQQKVQLFAQYFGEGIGSLQRLGDVLNLPSLPEVESRSVLSGPAEVEARDAVLRAGDEGEFELHNVSMHWKAGQTVCVVGAVGSGKTTLLLGVVRAIAPVSGSIRVRGGKDRKRKICD